MISMNPLKDIYFANTYALVICGGQSSRMGTDKSMLQYFDKPQRYHVYDMLLPLCKKIFISCNKEQVNTIESGYNFIEDEEIFKTIGPIVALLTASSRYPKKNMLLIGCDYPFLTVRDLELFSKYCNNVPAAFYNEAANVYEPMLAWYPHSCLSALKNMFAAKQSSLQQLLKQNHAVKYLPTDTNSIKSIDTREAFSQTIKGLNTG